MAKYASSIWAFIRTIYRGQQIETASATLLGIGVSWSWVSSLLPHWVAIYFWPTVIAIKTLAIAGLSSFITNYVSYRFKKFIDGKEKAPARRKGRNKRAA